MRMMHLAETGAGMMGRSTYPLATSKDQPVGETSVVVGFMDILALPLERQQRLDILSVCS
jgi:hypothetical protein